ncbi:oxidoreductase [Nocardia sp. NPDC088792]|uniref:oxidoreductase n=1 Tax=Nocardia sp. NPDC088792 TaxID=3364332 RepID=UPI003820C99D
MNEKQPWTASDMPDLHGRTAVVTGANAGLGLETARRLAERGAAVVFACRNPEKGAAAVAFVREQAPGAELSTVRLDLTVQESVRAAAAELHDRVDRVDLLVNNAGTLTRTRSETVDGFETTIATNHLGPFAFTGLLLDLLTASPEGRVVTVSSGTAGYRSTTFDIDDLDYRRRPYKPMRVYGQSKLANLLFTLELQRRLNGTDARLLAVAARPGVADSDFSQNFGPVRAFLSGAAPHWISRLFMQSTEMGALPTLRAATDPAVRGGEYFGPTGHAKGYPVLAEPVARAQDPEAAARLWEESERLTGVRYRFGPGGA